MNPTVSWKNLQIGQVLNIPCDDDSTGARVYTIVVGDTGDIIAAANSITFAQVDAFNPDVDWYNLKIGQTLLIPAPCVDATRIAQMVDISSLEQDGVIPAIVFTSSPTTFDDGLYHQASTSAVTSTITTGFPPIVNKPLTTSIATKSENTSAAMPIPTDMNDKSPFLTPPKGPVVSPRLIKAQNNAVSELINLRGVRNERSTEIASANQSQKRNKSDPYLVDSSLPLLPAIRSPSSSASVPNTYNVKPGDTGAAIASVYSLPFPSLSSTNPLQHGQHFNPVKSSHSLWAQKRPSSLPITTSCQTTPPAKTSTPSTPVPPLHSTHLYPRGLVLAPSRPTTSQQASV